MSLQEVRGGDELQVAAACRETVGELATDISLQGGGPAAVS
jgi:hypothetical protein